MAICPNCQFSNPEGLPTCNRCGQAWSTVDGAAVVVCEAESPDTPRPGISKLAAPLPEPMVEPIQTPPPPASDCHPPSSHSGLTLSLKEKSGVQELPWPVQAPQSAPPSAMTLRERPPAPTQSAPPRVELAPAPSTPSANAPSTPSAPGVLPPQVRPKLVVLRGQRVNAEYVVYEGRNTIGRFAEKPVDIDLLSQEAEGQVWSSRVHAAITYDRGMVFIEDLNSLNGTWINGARIHAGQQRMLKPNDVIQIGNVQLKVVLG